MARAARTFETAARPASRRRSALALHLVQLLGEPGAILGHDLDLGAGRGRRRLARHGGLGRVERGSEGGGGALDRIVRSTWRSIGAARRRDHGP